MRNRLVTSLCAFAWLICLLPWPTAEANDLYSAYSTRPPLPRLSTGSPGSVGGLGDARPVHFPAFLQDIEWGGWDEPEKSPEKKPERKPEKKQQEWDSGWEEGPRQDRDDDVDIEADEPVFERPREKGIPLDMFGARIGLWNATIDGELSLHNFELPDGQPGDKMDLGPDYGLDETQTPVWFEAIWQLEQPTWAIRLEPSYVWARYEGEEQVDIGEPQPFVDGWHLTTGTAWESTFDVAVAKLNARITPYIFKSRTGWFEFRPSLYGGSAYQRWILRLKLTNNPGGVGDLDGQIKDEFSAVIGHVGLHLEFRFSDFWFYLWASGMEFNRNELDANYYEGGIGIKYAIFDWLLVNVEGYGFRSRLDREDQFRFDYSMYGPSAFIILKI